MLPLAYGGSFVYYNENGRWWIILFLRSIMAIRYYPLQTWSLGSARRFITRKERAILQTKRGSSWPWSYGSWIYKYLCNQCLSPLMLWVRISIRGRCTTLCDQVCEWLATSRWFSPGPPVSTTNKTDRHDITEILLKVALNTKQRGGRRSRDRMVVGFKTTYAISAYH